jgi:hypothetical protein
MEIEKVEENIYEIDRPEMNVPARIYASEKLLETSKKTTHWDRPVTWHSYQVWKKMCA